MKKLSIIIGLIPIILLSSCNIEPTVYPRYSLKSITYLPDSLRIQHREYIFNTSKHSNESLRYIKSMADDIFEVERLGLKVEINGVTEQDYFLTPDRMSNTELKILDSLRQPNSGNNIKRVSEVKTK
tara:strand:+ start:132705 stop:133085 length:381 start_codon:yes stop_codon:yes gene_type:complete